ncbi:Outer membrane lipoprotein Omp16 [bacterium HR09]|nr:Outer membrane lipoprotein Omp16 [bacterium HR09]
MRRALGVGMLVILTLAVGCSRPKPVVAPEVSRPSQPAAPAAEPAPSREVAPEPAVQPASLPESEVSASELPADVEAINKAGYLKDVFFDTDKADLRPDARELLAQNARWLLQHPTVKILIEGHCDERNTNEYNLALGWRRANAVKDYLVSLGVAADRISTISYGEERPFATCHDESCWWQNRRAHFVVTGK